MDGATLQARIYSGYAKSAQRIGLPFTQYRPADPLAPLAAPIGTLYAHFRVDDSFARPNVHGKALWLAYIDGARVQAGDYLAGAPGTFFIAAMQPLLPVLAVACNRTVTAARIAAPPAVGALGYNADLPSAETPLMAGWPCSILRGQRGEKNEVGLPSDVRQPGWECLLPAWPGLQIRNADIITDDEGRRHIASACEHTDLGWRLTLQQAVT